MFCSSTKDVPSGYCRVCYIEGMRRVPCSNAALGLIILNADFVPSHTRTSTCVKTVLEVISILLSLGVQYSWQEQR